LFKADNELANRLRREIRERHPGLREALIEDARLATSQRGEPEVRPGPATVLQILRLCWSSDAFLAQAIYRVKAALLRRGVPILPSICHRLSIMIAGVMIGDPVVMRPGVHLLHGRVVIDGFTEIRPGVVIGPFVTIGLVSGEIVGPTIEEEATVGTGAVVLGKITVGREATIGANAAVLRDVPAGATVTGVPARPRSDD
jgi:serine O-acetyltransferase